MPVKLNVRDFMTEDQKADVDSGLASLDVTDAFQKAFDAAAHINALEAALREALQNWEEWNELHQSDSADRQTERERIAALRKQFLE